MLKAGCKTISGLVPAIKTAMKKGRSRIILTVAIVAVYFNATAQIANTIQPADKVFGLSKFWQEVNYNFAFLDIIGQPAWDSAYKAFIPQVLATQNDYKYYLLLKKFCALLKDGHTEVFMPPIKGLHFMNNMFGDYLLVLTRVDNKVIVKRTWKKDAAKFPLGSEVVEVNGLPTEKFIQDSIAPFIASSTDDVRKELASGTLLMGAPGTVFRVKLRKPQGEEVVYSLTHAQATDSIFLPNPGVYPDEKQREVLAWKALQDSIAYIEINSFAVEGRADSLFERLLPSLEKFKGVVIDLRYNGGGDDGVAFTILKHFIRDTVIVGAASVTRNHDPYLKAIGRYVNIADTAGDKMKKEAWLLYNGYAVYNQPGVGRSAIAANTKRLAVPLVVLTGHNTASAAEDFLIAADNQKHIVRIGESTNGSTGMPYRFDLPGGGSARICIKKDMYPDGREFVGKGIQPDIRVAPTVKDYLESRDIVLEAAVKYLASLRGNLKKSPNK